MPQPDRIATVRAREVLDSRGRPTVEAEVVCAGGATGRAIVPSGASTGRHEAVELRDGDPHRYGGLGVRKAVGHVRDLIGPALVGRSVLEQEAIDRLLIELDGTPDKSRLGANAILGASLACAHAAAAVRGMPLWRHLDTGSARMPVPMVNLISGGRHAGGNLDFQDFLLMPVGARSYPEALEMAVAVHRALGALLTAEGYEGVLVGDEGGFGPRLRSNEEAAAVCVRAIERAGLTPGRDAALALDVASTQFFRDGRYYPRDATPNRLSAEGMFELQDPSGRILGRFTPTESLSSAEMVELLAGWVERYPILSIEDGLAEDDWEGWRLLTERLGGRVQLIGDDLFTTNPERLRRGIAEKAANAVLVKPNQIGTLTETLAVVEEARAAGYRCVISARSGETEDTTIADLAVGTGAGQIKIGSVARSERLAKYNRLLRIDEELSGG
jgi:enolase